jgi:hypothetical protein
VYSTHNVARLAAAVALATGTAEAGTAGTARGGTLGAGRGDVALLAARVARLGLGGGALRGSERVINWFQRFPRPYSTITEDQG